MRKWLKSVVERIGDLIIKMISVKGLFAVGITIIAFKAQGSNDTIFWAGLAWCMLIGFREVQKFYTLMKGLELPGTGK